MTIHFPANPLNLGLEVGKVSQQKAKLNLDLSLNFDIVFFYSQIHVIKLYKFVKLDLKMNVGERRNKIKLHI